MMKSPCLHMWNHHRFGEICQAHQVARPMNHPAWTKRSSSVGTGNQLQPASGCVGCFSKAQERSPPKKKQETIGCWTRTTKDLTHDFTNLTNQNSAWTMDLSLMYHGFLFFTSLSWKCHAESGFNQPQNWGQPCITGDIRGPFRSSKPVLMDAAVSWF